jgi:hypothetical protein
MKKLLKKVIPFWLVIKYKKWRPNMKTSKFKKMSSKEIFTEIYNTNHWKSIESISGSGSEFTQTESFIKDLEKLLNDLKIRSLLDIPCGDFNWMQKVNLSQIDYIGADIVEELIVSNIDKFKERNDLEFKVIDLISGTLPTTDIIIIRDCLVHLSYENILKAIQNIKSSGCKYLLTTTFTNHQSNYDIVTGDWRPLNLQEHPFNFSNPILVINENCSEGSEFKDKSMALWEICKI